MVIEYMQTKLRTKHILFGIDRDGTLIQNNDFIGARPSWKKEINFNDDVIKFIHSVQTKYKTVKIVLSNQAGVARGLFTKKRVLEINKYIDQHLHLYGIKIDNWQSCLDVDRTYAKKHPEIKFLPNYVKTQTKRKPALDMMIDGLKQLKLNIKRFDVIVILGDRLEDNQFSQNIKGKYIDVKNKTYQELLNEFTKFIS